MAAQTYHYNLRFEKFRVNGGGNYAEHILITLGNYLSDACKKEILDCLHISYEGRENELEEDCLRVLSKHHVRFTYDILRG